jgi:SulP family sulfate permease
LAGGGKSKRWAANAVGGFIPATLVSIHCISVASIVFAGPLAFARPSAITLVLLSMVILQLAVGLGTRFRIAMVFPSYIAAVVLAPVCASIAEQLSARSDTRAILPTVMATIGLSSLLSGVFLVLLGRLKQSRAIRFVPYPIIGGFLGSAGWLLTKSGISIMTDMPLRWGNLSSLIQVDVALLVLPGLAFALVLLFLQNKSKHVLLLPGLSLLGIALAHAVVLSTSTTLPEAREASWFMSSYRTELGDLGLFFLGDHIDWNIVMTSLPSLAPIAVVTAIVVVLHSTALEVLLEEEGDLDNELRAIGFGNMLLGLLGGVVGIEASGTTELAKQAGADSWRSAIFAAATLGMFLLAGHRIVPMLPTLVVGGLSLAIGIRFLKTWLFDSYKRLAALDYWTIVIIVVTVATMSFLSGMVVGFLIASVLFVVRYSQLGVVKHSMSGAEKRSNVERPGSEFALLQRYGTQIRVLELQGYIFFGTAHTVYEEVKRSQETEKRSFLHYLILDMRSVTGMESSATVAFGKLQKLLAQKEGVLLFASLSAPIELLLRQNHVIAAQGKTAAQTDTGPRDNQVFHDMDRAIEWCEELILLEWELQRNRQFSIEEQLQGFLEPEQVEVFLSYLVRRDVEAGTRLVTQGAASDTMFFLAQGQVSVIGELKGGGTVRYRTYTQGTVIGELGLYTNQPRSASIDADEASLIFELRQADFDRLRKDDPTVALALHEYVVSILAKRMRRLDFEVRELLR